MNEIPQEIWKQQKIIQRIQLRLMRSATWSSRQRQGWVRFSKMYRQIQDSAFDPDEPNIALGYVVGIVEKMASRAVEPLLSMRPPVTPMPKKLGDGKSASNFSNILRDWYAKPNVQESLIRSKKGMIIRGSRWEIDEWQNVQLKGKMWGKVPKTVEVEVKGLDGKSIKARNVIMVDAEVDRTIPVHYGFNTRYPRIFDMYPEPDKPTIGTGQNTDVGWVVEDMGEVALEDLIRENYVDPHDGATKMVYDLFPMLRKYGRHAVERYERILKGGDTLDKYGPLIVPVQTWNYQSDYGRIDKSAVYGSETRVDNASSEDRDKVRVYRHYTADSIETVANGSFIIGRRVNPWHVPRLPIRCESLIVDDEFIYGKGIIEVNEDELNLLNDVKNLTMSQIIRSINKMMLVLEDAIVSMSDFTPRAGGRIRVRTGHDPRSVVAPIPQESPINEMIALQSEVKGGMEFTTSIMDGSMGVGGTKQSHKTYKGLALIDQNLSVTFQSILRMSLINEARRTMSMEDFFNQFGFEKRSYRVVRDDGSTITAEFNKDDIYTEGRGFDYVVEVDPLSGNDSVKKQQNLFMFDRAVEYERMRLERKDPKMRAIDLSQLMEKNLVDFGYRDFSAIFKMPDNERTPEEELEMLSQGALDVECSGDLINHVETHLMQAQSPGLKKAVEAGKVNPKTADNLLLLVQQALAKIRTFASDPGFAVQRKMAQAGVIR